MTIETTILDFQLSNMFEQYESHMNAGEKQSMFKEMGVKTFYIGKSLDDPQMATVIFQGPENVLYDILSILKQNLLLKLQCIFMRVQK